MVENAGLLIATLVYCIRLNKRLESIRGANDELRQLMTSFNAATEAARAWHLPQCSVKAVLAAAGVPTKPTSTSSPTVTASHRCRECVFMTRTLARLEDAGLTSIKWPTLSIS